MPRWRPDCSVADGAVLETERLILRPPVADDLPWLQDQVNAPGVMRHLGGIRSAERVAEGLENDIAAFASGDYRRWTVWLRVGACRVGRCGLFRVRSEAAPDGLRGRNEIGWTLVEDRWGQGYATEAARAVLGFGFGTLGHGAIFAQTSDSNRASTRMMGRLGFARRPELDWDDPDYPPQDNPTTVYHLTREAWQAADD